MAPPFQVTILAPGKMAARCSGPEMGVLGSPVLPMTMIGGVPIGCRSVTGCLPFGHETQPPNV